MAVTPTDKVQNTAPARPEPTPAAPAPAAKAPVKANQAPTPAADTDKAAPVSLSQAAAAKLTGANVHTYSGAGVVALDLPHDRSVNRAPDAPVPASSPGLAGANAATGTSPQAAASNAGAAAAFESFKNVATTKQTNALLTKGIAEQLLKLSGTRNVAIKQLASVLTTNRAAYLSDHPEAKRRLEHLTAELTAQLHGRMKPEEISKLATIALAREIMDMNGATGDVAGERLIAMPAYRYRMAMADRVAERAIQDGNLPPDVAKWVRGVAGRLSARAKALLRDGVSKGIQVESESHMVASGEMPANLSEAEHAKFVADGKLKALGELRAAGAYGRDGPAIISKETERVSSHRAKQVDYATYRALAHEAIVNTLNHHHGGDSVTFYDPRTKRTFSPSEQQLRVAAASYAPAYRSEADLPTGASDSGGVMVTGQVEHDAGSPDRFDPLHGPIAPSTARLLANDREVRAQDQRRHLAKKQVAMNVSIRRNANRDPAQHPHPGPVANSLTPGKLYT